MLMFYSYFLDFIKFLSEKLTILVHYYNILIMKIENTLRSIGLTEKQAKVYLAMLELGETSMTKLAKKSGLKRPTVYLIVGELNLLGLCGEIEKGKKKFYNAVHPRRLVQIAKRRAEDAYKILPELVALQKSDEKPKVRMLEGIKGVMIAYEEAFDLFNNKEEGLWIGDTGFLEERFPEVLGMYDQILGKLQHPHIRELVHGGEDSKKWVETMNSRKMKNYEARYIKGICEFGKTDQLIVGDRVMTFALGKEIFVMIVESKEIAQSQRALFDAIWNKK